MMDTTGVDENHDVTERSVGIQIETEEGVRTRHNQTQAADGLPKSLSPLINSMRLFGLYFARQPCVVHAPTSQVSRTVIRGCQGWTSARIYATIMFLVTWLNAVRNTLIFDGNETIGADLFTKLGMIPGVLLIAVLHTTYYVASHTGSLDKIFRQMNLFTSDYCVKYSRRAKVVMAVCWLTIAITIIYYVYLLFTREVFQDLFFLLMIKNVGIAVIIKVVSIILHISNMASWAFTQAMTRSAHKT